LTDDERVDAFFRCWTRKEAYIKATGDGLSLPLSQFDVSLAPGDENALLATRPETSEAARWLLREVPSGSGYAAAICVCGQDWKLKDWSKS
jgi:4'-phosphopantetheinyl transferase